MGMLAASIAVTRFKVDPLPHLPQAAFWEFVAERFQQHAFRPIDETVDERSRGFVQLNDHKEFAFRDAGATWIGTWLVFTMRQDTRRIPAAVLRDEISKAQVAWREKNPGYNRVPKQVREQLQEESRLRLLAKTLPVPSLVDAAWNVETNQLLLFTTTPRVIDTFARLFKMAFPECQLKPLAPFDLAASVIDPGLAEVLDQENKATTEAYLDRTKSNVWLGQDFLQQILAEPFVGSIVRGGYIDGKLALEGPTSSGVQKVTISYLNDLSERMETVKGALREGKTVTAAALTIEDPDNPEQLYRLMLKAETFAVSSFKTPPIIIDKQADDQASEFQAVVLEKLYLILRGLTLLDNRLSKFLANRLTSDWVSQQADCQAWLEEGA